MTAPNVFMTIAWIGALLGPPAAVVFLVRLRPAQRRSAPVLIGLVLYALAYGLGVWSFLIEPERLVVRRAAVASAGWRGPPLRIGILSDIHVGPHVSPARMRKVASALSAERPDVVVFLGDYAYGHMPADGHTAGFNARTQAGVAALGDVGAPLGRFAVLGNHDWWYDGPAIEAALRRSGVQVLENAAARVPRASGAFWIAGLADPESPRAAPSVARALRKAVPSEPVIVITHAPDPWSEVPGHVALALAGHTHCGQVDLPLIGRPFAPSPGARRWPCGLYEDGARKLFVTGGLGVSILPMRFRAPPEFVILTLSAAPQPLPSPP